MARKGPGRTLVDDVYGRLKEDICGGRLTPGERLNLAEVAKAHEVSLTVVREAVTRLASHRLVKSVPQQGFTVWPLSVDDLLDLTRVRIEIETLAVSESVLEGDLAWEAELVGAHHLLAGAGRNPAPPGARPSDAWMEAHAGFHEALAAACTSPLLKDLRRQLFDASELYRHWSVTLGPSTRRPVAKEHAAILDAALSHDVDRAVALLADHIQGTTDRIVAGRAEASAAS